MVLPAGILALPDDYDHNMTVYLVLQCYDSIYTYNAFINTSINGFYCSTHKSYLYQ